MKKITNISELKKTSTNIRIDIIKMLNKSGSGHPGGALGATDIFTALYFNLMNHDSKKPNSKSRDYFILSNGHICPALYATLAHSGYFNTNELMTLRKFNSRLQGHPHRETLPGLETTSGPLGSGISQGAGMALGLKLDKKPNLVYCLTSDGEHDEGNTWEGVMFANKYKLNNLICIMDKNNIQLSGLKEDIMPIGDIVGKYKSNGWHVEEVDGHNFNQLIKTIKPHKSKPTMVIANTVLGKGVSFMENNYKWHGKAPNDEEAKQAIGELKNVKN